MKERNFMKRIVVFAFDHGFEHGPSDFGYRSTKKILERVIDSGVDAVMLLPGTAKIFRDIWEGRTNLIMKLTSKTNLRPEKERYLQSLVGTVEEALRYRAAAVAATIYWGSPYEDLMLRRWSYIKSKAEKYGIPLVQLAYPRGPHIENRYDFKIVSYGVRAAVESGADIIKTYYTGDPESFRKVVEIAEGVPVLMAGGPKAKSLIEFLRQVRECLDAGCSGVAVGRNVFQSEDPARAIRAIMNLVHKDMEPKEALES